MEEDKRTKTERKEREHCTRGMCIKGEEMTHAQSEGKINGDGNGILMKEKEKWKNVGEKRRSNEYLNPNNNKK